LNSIPNIHTVLNNTLEYAKINSFPLRILLSDMAYSCVFILASLISVGLPSAQTLQANNLYFTDTACMAELTVPKPTAFFAWCDRKLQQASVTSSLLSENNSSDINDFGDSPCVISASAGTTDAGSGISQDFLAATTNSTVSIRFPSAAAYGGSTSKHYECLSPMTESMAIAKQAEASVLVFIATVLLFIMLCI